MGLVFASKRKKRKIEIAQLCLSFLKDDVLVVEMTEEVLLRFYACA